MLLMNSAMMPVPGMYRCESISRETFCALLKADPSPLSYIGYQQNVDLIREWTGISLPVSHEQTIMEAGDQALVMRLDYRAAGTKGRKVGENDFSFFMVTRLE